MIAERFIGRVLRDSTTLKRENPLHGLDHWWRVWKNAEKIATFTPDVDMEVVALFALLHDSMRDNDHDDIDHGLRGWHLWWRSDDKHMLNAAQNELLMITCTQHSLGTTHMEITVGACWDADRLDLYRLGIAPHARYMSTLAGVRMATPSLP